jgi:HD-like signal output (HDOD) protein
MLHNCGLLVVAENLPQSLVRVIAAARSHGAPLARFEREIYGATHAEIGGYLLGLWGLPASIVESVIFHSSAIPGGPPRRFGTLALVHVAQALVGERIKTIEGVPASPLNLAWITDLGFADRLPAWRDAVAEVVGDSG